MVRAAYSHPGSNAPTDTRSVAPIAKRAASTAGRDEALRQGLLDSPAIKAWSADAVNGAEFLPADEP